MNCSVSSGFTEGEAREKAWYSPTNTLRAGTREVAISFCATAQYSFRLVIAMGCWPTTIGRGSLAHPARARPRERQANLRTVSSGNPRMMDFMGAIPLLENPGEENDRCERGRSMKLRIAGHSGVTSCAESWAQFS